jgi:hypothetical protein
MAETFNDRVEITKTADSDDVVITLDAASGDITSGGDGQDGDLVLRHSDGRETIHLDGDGQNITIKRPTGETLVELGKNGNLHLGGGGLDGDLVLNDVDGAQRIHLGAGERNIVIRNADGTELVELGKHGNLYLGGGGLDGDVVLRDGEGNQRMHLGAGERNIVIRDADGTELVELGKHGNLYLGGSGLDGDLVLRDGEGTQRMHLGGAERNLIMRTADGEETVELGRLGNLYMGGHGHDGDVLLFPSEADDIADAAQSTVWLNGQDGNIMLGGNGHDGDIALFPGSATISQSDFSAATIRMDGDAGDIVLQNADCAEEFDVVDDTVEPGTVMVLDDSGALEPSTSAYDTRVAGVVSGAGEFKPGIVLDKQHEHGGRLPIALMGKVNCLVDATDEPVDAGDLLVSSDEPNHAMKATDPTRSFGAVIGKALHPLESGRGLVPMLISLQ